jgi:5-methylcytosine-specific restriction endonuclease McrA
MTLPELRADLYTLLERFVLGDRRAIANAPTHSDVAYSVEHALELLDAHSEHMFETLYELRIRIALHYAPTSAISYDRRNTKPRHRIIREHIQNSTRRSGALVEQLARDVAKVLDEWDKSRERVTGYLEALLARQCCRCGNCGVVLAPTPRSIVGDDPFKPYYESPDELLAAEVDHIEPISGFGTNRTDNLQALCRLCNQGKGDGLGLDIREEIRHAAVPLLSIPRAHRIRMFAAVIARQRSNFVSDLQFAPPVELTIRKRSEEGGFVRSNLSVIQAEFGGIVEFAED